MEARETLIDALVKGWRTIERAHADLLAKFALEGTVELARMIGELEL